MPKGDWSPQFVEMRDNPGTRWGLAWGLVVYALQQMTHFQWVGGGIWRAEADETENYIYAIALPL